MFKIRSVSDQKYLDTFKIWFFLPLQNTVHQNFCPERVDIARTENT